MRSDHQLHILSYNIHKGFSLQRKFVLRHIKEAIKTSGADLVFLQEVLNEHSHFKKKLKEWPMEPQLEYLAHQIWPHFAYGKNAVYSEGHHGNAILSLHPFKLYENIDVSNNRFERRGILHGTIHMPSWSCDLHVICLHFDLFERGRRLQVKRLAERIERHVPHECPLIIAGDFNDWRENATTVLESLLDVKEVFKLKHGAHAKSFPSWLPFLPLDRIYARGFTVQSATVFEGDPWKQLSDHAALFTELELHPESAARARSVK